MAQVNATVEKSALSGDVWMGATAGFLAALATVFLTHWLEERRELRAQRRAIIAKLQGLAKILPTMEHDRVLAKIYRAAAEARGYLGYSYDESKEEARYWREQSNLLALQGTLVRRELSESLALIRTSFPLSSDVVTLVASLEALGYAKFDEPPRFKQESELAQWEASEKAKLQETADLLEKVVKQLIVLLERHVPHGKLTKR